MLVGGVAKHDEDDAMQDLIREYASDLNKLREAFHNELTATADELSNALGVYAQRSEAALASFVGWSWKCRRRRGSISFAVSRQKAISRTSMTNH